MVPIPPVMILILNPYISIITGGINTKSISVAEVLVVSILNPCVSDIIFQKMYKN